MNDLLLSSARRISRPRGSRQFAAWSFVSPVVLLTALSPLSAQVADPLASVRNWYAAGPEATLEPSSELTSKLVPELIPGLALAPAAAQSTPAGFGPLDPTPPKDITVDQIIAKFGQRESAFATARDEYTFRQSVKIQTIDDDKNRPDGVYQQVTDIVFSNEGKRAEHVVFAPQNTIERVIMTQNDFDDIEHRLPFVLTAPEIPEYDLTYLGRQHVDEIDTYVFDCKPKVMEKNKRYFQGKVWVDQQQYEIVLINGKSVPDILKRGHEDLSPPYTTYYSEVDGGNWFPIYTKADGTLHFPAQQGAMPMDVHLRYTVHYDDYKRFHAKSRIIYNGEDLPADGAAKPGQTPANTPSAQPPPTDTNALPPADPDAPSLSHPKAASPK